MKAASLQQAVHDWSPHPYVQVKRFSMMKKHFLPLKGLLHEVEMVYSDTVE
jgi:hypothetical protein